MLEIMDQGCYPLASGHKILLQLPPQAKHEKREVPGLKGSDQLEFVEQNDGCYNPKILLIDSPALRWNSSLNKHPASTSIDRVRSIRP